jgi:hypothetical protein
MGKYLSLIRENPNEKDERNEISPPDPTPFFVNSFISLPVKENEMPASSAIQVLNGGVEDKALSVVVMPEPLEPSPLWLEAITQAETLDPTANYLVGLLVPEYLDHTDVKLYRETEGHTLPNALKALSLRFPAAVGVEIAKPKTLEVLVAVGAAIPKWEGKNHE